MVEIIDFSEEGRKCCFLVIKSKTFHEAVGLKTHNVR